MFLLSALFRGLVLRPANVLLALIVNNGNLCNPIYLGIVVPGVQYCGNCSVELATSSSRKASPIDLVLKIDATCRKEESSRNTILVRSESEPVRWTDLLVYGVGLDGDYWTKLIMDIAGRSVELDFEVHLFGSNPTPQFYSVGESPAVSAQQSSLEVDDAIACAYESGVVRCGSDVCFDPIQLEEVPKCDELDFVTGSRKVELE